jgi:hypothetical protein
MASDGMIQKPRFIKICSNVQVKLGSSVGIANGKDLRYMSLRGTQMA